MKIQGNWWALEGPDEDGGLRLRLGAAGAWKTGWLSLSTLELRELISIAKAFDLLERSEEIGP
jgi:hypothetical protein